MLWAVPFPLAVPGCLSSAQRFLSLSLAGDITPTPTTPCLVLPFAPLLPSPLVFLLSCFPQHAAHLSKETPNKGADVMLVARQLLQVLPGLRYYRRCDFFIPLLTLQAFIEQLSLAGQDLSLYLRAP